MVADEQKNTREAVVLLGDLVDSRLIATRQEFAEWLEKHLDAVSFRYGGLADRRGLSIALTKGIDEVSAVLEMPTMGYLIAFEINLAIWPQRFRWGLGDGLIDVNSRSKNISDMDGPAFHAAAEALRFAEEDRKLFSTKLKNMAASSQELIREAADVISIRMADWTEAQARSVQLERQLDSQVQVAKTLKISPQAVSKNLERACYPQIAALERAIRSVLTDYS